MSIQVLWCLAKFSRSTGGTRGRFVAQLVPGQVLVGQWCPPCWSLGWGCSCSHGAVACGVRGRTQGSVSTAHQQQCCCRSVLLHGTRSLSSGKGALMQNWWPKVQGLDSFYRLTVQRHFWLNWERKIVKGGTEGMSTDYPIWHCSMRVSWGLAGKSSRYPAGECLGQPQGWLLGAAARSFWMWTVVVWPLYGLGNSAEECPCIPWQRGKFFNVLKGERTEECSCRASGSFFISWAINRNFHGTCGWHQPAIGNRK